MRPCCPFQTVLGAELLPILWEDAEKELCGLRKWCLGLGVTEQGREGDTTRGRGPWGFSLGFPRVGVPRRAPRPEQGNQGLEGQWGSTTGCGKGSLAVGSPRGLSFGSERQEKGQRVDCEHRVGLGLRLTGPCIPAGAGADPCDRHSEASSYSTVDSHQLSPSGRDQLFKR